MKYGVVTGAEGLLTAQAVGFDFVELPLARVVSPLLGDGDRETSAKLLADAQIPVEAGCVFFPAEMKVIGPDTDDRAISDYVDAVLDRSADLGIEIAVFGSGKSRNIPDGFPVKEAQNQVDALLRMMGDRAQARGITIVIEPLNTKECNWINSVEDAGAIVRRIDHPNVKALADLYHISVEKEGFHGVLAVGYDIEHVHVSSADRSPPKEDGADWTSMFRALKALGYDSRLSMECRWTDFENEAPGALDFLKRAWDESF
jgi:sugar phosphate isomerase/epimerase